MAAYLVSATIRPAAAYFAHLRERISTLSRESLHPREDVVALWEKVAGLVKTVTNLDEELTAARPRVSARRSWDGGSTP
jgi:hypothetical protein